VQPAFPPPLFLGGTHEADAFVGGAKPHHGMPTSLGRLVHLRSLRLEQNFISFVPMELGRLERVEDMNLFNNPGLYQPPPDVMVRGCKCWLTSSASCSTRASRASTPTVGTFTSLMTSSTFLLPRTRMRRIPPPPPLPPPPPPPPRNPSSRSMPMVCSQGVLFNWYSIQ
jgi:hypothetical protein